MAEYAPGIIYVSDRSADSICDTALLFFVMNSEYIPSNLGGSDRTSVVRRVACLYILTAPVNGCSNTAYRWGRGGVGSGRRLGSRSSRSGMLSWPARLPRYNSRIRVSQAKLHKHTNYFLFTSAPKYDHFSA